VIDVNTQTLIQDILRRESRSVLRYVAEAFPWINANEDRALATVQRIIAAERQAVVELGQFLIRQRVALPFFPSYPASFTTINFLAFDYVLPLLVDYERESAAALERDLSAIKDVAAYAAVEKLLTVKRHNLTQLKELVPAHSQASLI
jgi:hypothetical protein